MTYINESRVYFFSGGGHDHDGENSTLIDTSSYSLFDFSYGIFGNPDRRSAQQTNLNGLKQLIINTVNDSLIRPAGIELQPGIINGNAHIISRSITATEIAADSITANEIAANTITANELSANIVLVNNIIQSNDYVANTSGWAIHGNGFAEFDFAVIRGTVIADSIYINADNYWWSNGIFSTGDVNNYMRYNGNSLSISGAVFATSGQIAGWEIVGDNLRAGANFVGSMELGAFTGTSGAAGVLIEGPTANAPGNVAILISDFLEMSDASGSYTQITPDGAVYQYAADTWEFYFDGSDLFAVVNGNFYCLQQCGSPPPPVGVTPTVGVGVVVGVGTVVGVGSPCGPVDCGGVLCDTCNCSCEVDPLYGFFCIC